MTRPIKVCADVGEQIMWALAWRAERLRWQADDKGDSDPLLSDVCTESFAGCKQGSTVALLYTRRLTNRWSNRRSLSHAISSDQSQKDDLVSGGRTDERARSLACPPERATSHSHASRPQARIRQHPV